MEETNFKFRFLFTSEGRMQGETGRPIGAATAVVCSLYRFVMVKKDRIPKVKRLIHESIHVPTLT